MTSEPLSPELVLVDPDLAARARAALPMPPPPAPARPLVPTPRLGAGRPPAHRPSAAHPYPLWARVTAAMWLVVIGILIGGAAIPHAQDTPHLIPGSSGAAVCQQSPTPALPRIPIGPGQ